MTQYYTDRKFALTTAPLHTRVLITSFNVVILVALIVGLINYWDKTGMTPSGVTAWYRGNENATLAAGQSMTFEKSFRELLDATHPHLFGQGVLLFILSHIVALTGLSQRSKIIIYLVSFGAMLLDAAVPWLIRYGSPSLAPVQILSMTLLTGAFVAQMWFPVREMWFSPAVAPAAKSPVEPRAERPASSRPPRRERPDSFHRTGRAPSSEPRAARPPRPERSATPEGDRDPNEPRRGNRRRRGRRPGGRPSGPDSNGVPVPATPGSDSEQT